MKLDRKAPFGNVHGAHGGAATYQCGHYFGVDDEYLFSDPGVSPPAGVKPRAEAPAPDAAPAEAGGAETAPSEGDPLVPAGMSREQMLNQMTVANLKTLVVAAGGEPVVGSGAKKKMISWLLDNTQ